MTNHISEVLKNANAGRDAHDEAIRERIVIREDFKSLIPQLADDELAQLERNILDEGVRDPLVIWKYKDSYILIDGHNRLSICLKHAKTYPFKKVDFKDENEAHDWIINNQLGRRNLSKEMLTYIWGLLYNKEKSQGRRSDLATLDQNDPKLKKSTAKVLAERHNVSEATIKRAGEFAAAIDKMDDPQLRKEILNGKSKLSKNEIISMANNSLPASNENDSNTSKSVKPSAKSLTVNQIAEIALNYVKTESRSIDEVCQQLGEDPTSLVPKEFFLKWNSSR